VKVKHPKDFWAGWMLIAFGVAAIVIGSNYPLGTAARMGPGYFPRILGIILVLFGGFLAVRALRLQGSPISAVVARPLVVILGSLTLFGMLLQPLGIFLSTILLIVLSSMASREFTWRASAIGSVVLAVFCYLVFSVGLNLQFPLWPWFVGD